MPEAFLSVVMKNKKRESISTSSDLVITGGRIQKQYGPYEITIEVTYTPKYDPNVEDGFRLQDFVGKAGSLTSVARHILMMAKSFFGWNEGRLSDTEVKKARREVHSKVYTDEELIRESLSELRGETE